MAKRKPQDVDAYIAAAPAEAQAMLRELREIIRATVPGAEEGIAWNVPYYRYHGELTGFDAAKQHVSFGFGKGVLDDADREALADDGYGLGKETLRIRFDQEVPKAAIEKMLKRKAAMNEAEAE